MSDQQQAVILRARWWASRRWHYDEDGERLDLYPITPEAMAELDAILNGENDK